MSFYPAPTFPTVATMVNYSLSSAPCCFRAAIPAAVPLSQSLVAPLPVPTVPAVAAVTTVLERKPCDGHSNFNNSDPVTKAVMDNIMGKLPTKKQSVTSKCEVCCLEFSGQVVLETHLAGAKHAKKVKSQEILKLLQGPGQTFTRDEKTRILKCEVCDVVVNSSQQLQTHLAGNKHRQKAMKKVSGVNPVKSPAATAASNPPPPPPPPSIVENKGAGSTCAETTSTGTSSASGAAEVPAGMQKLPDASGSKSNKYFCDTCTVSLNSEIQLEQHLGSRRHKDRLMNGGKGKARPAPYWKKPRNTFQQQQQHSGGGKSSKVPMMLQYTQPLSSNFVSGGAMM